MKPRNPDITHADVLSLFDYSDGNLIWRVASSTNVRAGRVAGYRQSTGYTRIHAHGKLHLAHRLIWFWHHGTWPEYEIDHINGDKSDNRIENLREATPSQNKCNIGRNSTNTSGCKGVSYDKINKKWLATIRYNGRQRYLGRFDCKERAKEFRDLVAEMTHGEFARS